MFFIRSPNYKFLNLACQIAYGPEYCATQASSLVIVDTKRFELRIANKIGTLRKNSKNIRKARYLSGKNAMEWLQKWLDRRRVKALKLKIARMKIEAEAAEVEPLMPAMETISHRIRMERLVVLEKAVEKIDSQQNSGASPLARIPHTTKA